MVFSTVISFSALISVPSTVALIMAVPALTPVTKPLLLTLAMSSSLLDQVSSASIVSSFWSKTLAIKLIV